MVGIAVIRKMRLCLNTRLLLHLFYMFCGDWISSGEEDSFFVCVYP